MKNVHVDFELYNGDLSNFKRYEPVGTHLIFGIKLGKKNCIKVRCIGDGHRTEIPSSVTYSYVVSRDSVRIGLLIVALNELDIKCADIQHAYLTAPCAEKLYMWAGPEFGNNKGEPFIIVRVLCCLCNAGASF